MDGQYARQGEIRTSDVRVAVYLLAPNHELIDVEASEEVCGPIILISTLPFHDRSVPDSHDANR